MNFKILPSNRLFFKLFNIAFLIVGISHAAFAMKKDEIIPTRIVNADINLIKQANANAFLLCAVINGHIAQTNEALKCGANVNFVTKDGWTPLHFASYWGHLEIVKILLRWGAHSEATTYADLKYDVFSEETPLHWACKRGHTNVVKELLDNGSEINCLAINHITGLAMSPLGMARESAEYIKINQLICHEFLKRKLEQEYKSLIFARLLASDQKTHALDAANLLALNRK